MLDVYNGIGIVLANRTDHQEAIPYLEKATAVHKMVIDVCTENLPTYIEQLELTALDKEILRE